MMTYAVRILLKGAGHTAAVAALWGASAAFVWGGVYGFNAGIDWITGGPSLGGSRPGVRTGL